jgi:hypothetical protein
MAGQASALPHADSTAIAQRLLEASPVLEAFGNAATVRNHNSSRFGKWIEIALGPAGEITSAAVRIFLLEKSRITRHSAGERTYHVFYLLLDALNRLNERAKPSGPAEPDTAAPPKVRRFAELELSGPFAFLLPESARAPEPPRKPSVAHVGDAPTATEHLHSQRSAATTAHRGGVGAERLEDVLQSCAVLGMDEVEQRGVLRLLAAVLHLGNVRFGDADESAAVRPKPHRPASAVHRPCKCTHSLLCADALHVHAATRRRLRRALQLGYPCGGCTIDR